MNIFDKYIERTEELIRSQWKAFGKTGNCAAAAAAGGPSWPRGARNPFLMERDAAAELGGYPRESINLILSTSTEVDDKDGVFIIGEQDMLAGSDKHISFGKIVILTVSGVEDDRIYDYTQQVQMADSRLFFENIMVRTSPKQFMTNLRIGKAAMAEGFSLEAMGRTIHDYFMELPQVTAAKVVLIAGETPVYRQLMPIAENVKHITAALNTMFDGIDMDCGSCAMSPICDEVEGLRQLHKVAASK